MAWIALVVAGLVVIGLTRALLRRQAPKKTPKPQTAAPRTAAIASKPLTTQDRLTDNQILCLSGASTSSPIYAESPSHMYSQMPNGAACFNQRTVDSLVKRGFLESDQRGGYLLTEEGMIGLKRGMGFRD